MWSSWCAIMNITSELNLQTPKPNLLLPAFLLSLALQIGSYWSTLITLLNSTLSANIKLLPLILLQGPHFLSWTLKAVSSFIKMIHTVALIIIHSKKVTIDAPRTLDMNLWYTSASLFLQIRIVNLIEEVNLWIYYLINVPSLKGFLYYSGWE